MVNRVQAARRDAGLEITDRIVLTWETNDDELAEAIDAHTQLISDEVLAESMVRSGGATTVVLGGTTLELSVTPV